MQITRNELDTAKGSEDGFTGDVYVDTAVAPPRAAPEVLTTSPPVPEPPGTPTRSARRSSSPRGSAGASARGGPVEEIRPGDRCTSSPTRRIGTAQHRPGS
jgi:hypothetical protein